MKLICSLLTLALFTTASLFSQSIDVGLFVGGANYSGELQSKSLEFKHAHLAFGGTVTYNINDRVAVRGNIMKSNVSGADAWNPNEEAKLRNLSFTTRLYEVNLQGKFRILRPETSRISPYVAAGVAVFRVNPYAYDYFGTKTYLYRLSTEGQGLPDYPERAPHKLYHFSIPFGGGVEYQLTNRFTIEAEFMMRKTFMDYIDDVSTSYVDPIALLQEKGATAVAMAYRGGELPNGSMVYPIPGTMRGNPDKQDWYYTGVIRINYRLFGAESGGYSSGGVGGGRMKKYRHRTDCPAVW